MRPASGLLLLLLTVSLSFSQILWNPDGVAVRQAEHIGWDKAAAKNAQGEICFIWSDCRIDGVRRIYAQKRPGFLVCNHDAIECTLEYRAQFLL